DDLVEESLLQGGPQQEKERTDGGLTDQGDLVARDDHRNTGLGKRPAQHRNLPHGAPHEHRHPRPGDAVEEVSAAQLAGHQGGLLGFGVGDHSAYFVGGSRGVAPPDRHSTHFIGGSRGVAPPDRHSTHFIGGSRGVAPPHGLSAHFAFV